MDMETDMHSQERSRTAIITGSSRGIGKATAILLAKRGVNVVICSRSEKEINSAVQEAFAKIAQLKADFGDWCNRY
jgi:NAD(P)-dependent dehydrogenase (short-subunit alcohol dehydrogenase family)